MTIQENVALAQYTTFKIGGPARFFCIVTKEDELLEAVKFAEQKKMRFFVLGGGSNILMSDKGFDGLVVKMEIKGIKIQDSGFRIQDYSSPNVSEKRSKVSEDKHDSVVVSVGAGEDWDSLVEHTVEKGLYGLENLSAIPGTVGAAPVQNIGAYGAEVSNIIVTVHALDTKNMILVELSNEECHFSYRESVFKKEKGRYIITRVEFALHQHVAVNIEYRDLANYFSEKSIATPTLREVRDAVIDIRWNKLPDWKLWGTAGSFFKNPIISADHFSTLKKSYPDLLGFPEHDGRVKVSLGWILDKVCNVKGLKKGHVQVYEKQALVLVATPGATSEEVVDLAQDLMKVVKEKTGIEVEGEVEWVN